MFVPLFADFSQLRRLTSLALKLSITSFWIWDILRIIEAAVAVLSCILKQAVEADQLSHITFHFEPNRDDLEAVSPILHTIDDILSTATFIKVKSVHIFFASGIEGFLVDNKRDFIVDTVRAALPRCLKRGIVKLFIR